MASNQERGSSANVKSEDTIRKNFNTFRDYLEKAVSVKDLVGHSDLFNREQKNELLLTTQTKPTYATKRAFEIIEQHSRSDRYTHFLQVLDESGYPKLVGLLNGNYVHTNDYHFKRLNWATPLIYHRLNPSEALPHLLRYGVVSIEDAAEISKLESNKSRAEAALTLQYILPNRHRHWYGLTIKSFVESGQSELAEEIDPELTKAIQSNDKHDSSLCGSEISLESISLVQDCTYFAEFGMSGNECQNNPQQKGHYTDVSRFIQNCEEVNQSDQTKEFDLMITKMKSLMENLEILLKDGKKNCLLTTVHNACRTYIESVNDGIDKIQEMLLTEIDVSETGEIMPDLQTNVENLSQQYVGVREVNRKHSVPRVSNRVPLIGKNKTISSIRRVKVKLNDDEQLLGITGCTCMSNGEFVLCDYGNQKVKLLGKEWKIKDSIKLGSIPWDVSTIIDSKTVVVTLPVKNQLQYLQVFPKLKSVRTIQLNKWCWGICVFDNELYVSFSDKLPDSGEIRVLDYNGNVKRLIKLNTNGFPFYLTINTVSKNILVPHGSNLSCLTPSGKLLYDFKKGGRQAGVCVDEDGNVLMCNSDTNEVNIVTDAGTKYENLLSAKHGITNPLCISHRRSDGIIVVGDMSDDLIIFKLGQ